MTDTLHEHQYTFLICLAQFLECDMLQTKGIEKIETYCMLTFRNLASYI